MNVMLDMVQLCIAFCYVVQPMADKKCHTKRCLELWTNTVGHMTFWCIQHVSQAYTCVYTYVKLSCFLIMHPDLVLVISPSCMVKMFPLNSSVPFFLLMPILLMECSMFSATCWLWLLTICPMLCSSSTTLFNTCLLLYAPGFCLCCWVYLLMHLLICYIVYMIGVLCMHLLSLLLALCVIYSMYCICHLLLVGLCMIYFGDYGHHCQLPSHGSTVCHLLTGPLQLTLLGYKKTLVGYYCHFCVACPWACCNGHHHSPAW